MHFFRYDNKTLTKMNDDGDDEVLISFEDYTTELSISDLNLETLKKTFELNFDPVKVILEGTNKIVLLENKKKFVAGKIIKDAGIV